MENVKHVQTMNSQTHETQSASVQHSKGNVKHIPTAQNSVSLRSTQEGECQVRTCCEHAHTHKTRSASDQPSMENVKHIQPMNSQTHETWSASDQPSKGNVKHVQSAKTQTHKIRSASDQPSMENVKHVHRYPHPARNFVSQPSKQIIKYDLRHWRDQPSRKVTW